MGRRELPTNVSGEYDTDVARLLGTRRPGSSAVHVGDHSFLGGAFAPGIQKGSPSTRTGDPTLAEGAAAASADIACPSHHTVSIAPESTSDSAVETSDVSTQTILQQLDQLLAPFKPTDPAPSAEPRPARDPKLTLAR